MVRKNSVRAGFRVDVTLLHRNRVLVSDFWRSTPVEPDSTAGFTLRALVGMQERENLPLGKEKTSPAARLMYVSLDRSRRRHRGWPAFLFFLPTRPQRHNATPASQRRVNGPVVLDAPSLTLFKGGAFGFPSTRSGNLRWSASIR